MATPTKVAPMFPVFQFAPVGKTPTPSVLEAAKHFITEGLFPVPINPQVWGPTFDGWPSFACLPKDVAKHFTEGEPIGLILASSGLLDIDLDAPEVQAFADWFPKTRAITRKSKGTSHLLYRISGDIEAKSYKAPDGTMLIEFRAGNRAVVVPPSVHPSGEPLEWFGSPNYAKADSEAIRRLTAEVAALSLIASSWPNHSRHDAALATAGVLQRCGWSLDRASDAMWRTAKAAHDEEPKDRVKAIETTYKQAEDGKPYSGVPTFAGLFGEATTKLICNWLGTPDKLDESPAKLPLRPHVFSLGEFLQQKFPLPEYIIEPWLPSRALAMAFAYRGVGKTFFVMEIAFSVAEGRPLFGVWNVPKPRRVLIIDSEMPMARLQQRFLGLWNQCPEVKENIRLLPCDSLWAKGDSLNIANPETQRRVDDLLSGMVGEGWRPDLIVLDNLSSLVWGVDENSNSEQDAVIRWLISLRSRGYTVLVVHHSTKNGKSQRGASRKEDVLDTIIHLEPESGPDTRFNMSFVKLRGEKPNPISLTVTLKKGANDDLVWVTGKPQVPAYLLALKAIAQDMPKTLGALGKSLDISRPAATKHVEKLMKEGLATKKPLALTKKGHDLYKAKFDVQGDELDS